MKIALIITSMLFAGSVFAQEPTTPPTESTGHEMAAPTAPTEAPVKKEHKKKGKKKAHK